MKIVFVIPDQLDLQNVLKLRGLARVGIQPNLGLLSVATVAKNIGADVRIYDNYVERKHHWEISEKIMNENPDVDIIGFSLNCLNIFEAKNMLSYMKRNFDKKVLYLAGGPHVTICTDDCMDFDCCAKGDGETAIEEIMYRMNNNLEVPKIIDIERVINLDRIPFPDRSLISHIPYNKKATNITDKVIENLNTSRGCTWGACRFCDTQNIFGRKYTYRSPEKVIEEIRYLKELGAQGMFFREDTFTGNSKRVERICEEFLKPENSDLHHLVFHGYARVKPFSEEVLQSLLKMNFQSLFIGFDSGSNETLKNIKKGYTNTDSFNLIDRLNKNGIKYGAGFLQGFPDETIDNIKDTYEMAMIDSHSYVYLQTYCGYPTSPIYEECIEEGLTEEWFGKVFAARTKHVSREKLREIEDNFPRNKFFPDEPQNFIDRIFVSKDFVEKELEFSRNDYNYESKDFIDSLK